MLLRRPTNGTAWSDTVLAAIHAHYPAVNRPVDDSAHARVITVTEPVFAGDTARVELRLAVCATEPAARNHFVSISYLRFVRVAPETWRYESAGEFVGDGHCGPSPPSLASSRTAAG